MNRWKSSTRTMVAVVAACLLCCTVAQAKKPAGESVAHQPQLTGRSLRLAAHRSGGDQRRLNARRGYH